MTWKRYAEALMVLGSFATAATIAAMAIDWHPIYVVPLICGAGSVWCGWILRRIS